MAALLAWASGGRVNAAVARAEAALPRLAQEADRLTTQERYTTWDLSELTMIRARTALRVAELSLRGAAWVAARRRPQASKVAETPASGAVTFPPGAVSHYADIA